MVLKLSLLSFIISVGVYQSCGTAEFSSDTGLLGGKATAHQPQTPEVPSSQSTHDVPNSNPNSDPSQQNDCIGQNQNQSEQSHSEQNEQNEQNQSDSDWDQSTAHCQPGQNNGEQNQSQNQNQTQNQSR